MTSTKRVKRIIKASTEPEFITITEAFEMFITEKEAQNLSPKTIHNYTQTLNMFMEFHDLHTESTTDEITQHLVFKWINTMKLNGVKPASINHYLRDLRTFFYWCMDKDRQYIVDDFKIKMIEAQEEQLKLFSDEELEALLEKPRRQDSFRVWRTWAIVNWILATGNRVATICEVKISDISFSHREITLHHTKNKKAQILPLSSSLETVLKEYIRMWRKEAPIDGWLFPNVGEEQLTTNALRCGFVYYCEQRGVEHANPHGLRHNFAKGWVRNNGNMFALQTILGHSTLDMTRKYVKMFSEDIKTDFDSFSPLDTIKKNSKRTQTIKRSKDW